MLQNRAVVMEEVFIFFLDIPKLYFLGVSETAYGTSSFTFNRFQHRAKRH